MKLFRESVQERNRKSVIALVQASDFRTAGPTEISLNELIESPHWSLYCFDLELDQAVFVHVTDVERLNSAAFYYQAQAELAESVCRIPMSIFNETAAEHQALLSRLLMVHSVGRCGSTLMSRLLGICKGVQSLSEPDEFTQLGRMKASRAASSEWISAAKRSAAIWRSLQLKPTERLAIKTRGEVLVLAQEIAELFPDAQHMFLYRNAVEWMRSVYKGWNPSFDPYDPVQCLKIQQSWAGTLPSVRQKMEAGIQQDAFEIRLEAWITCLLGYLTIRESGTPIQAVRFEDLRGESAKTHIPSVLAAFQLEPNSPEELERVMGEDSQAGTLYDRQKRSQLDRVLPESVVKMIERQLSEVPQLGSPDVCVPGTLLPRSA